MQKGIILDLYLRNYIGNDAEVEWLMKESNK